MTDKIEALRELAAAATPGPWIVEEDCGWDEAWCNWHKVGPISFMGERVNKNSSFIAAASPDVILSLLSELDRLRSSNEAMRKALETADAAIAYYIRYLDGGEMRGSYDGKPERDALRRAGHATRAALSLQEEEAR